ncbi:ATP-binding protein [Lutibacter citreus]|uniref:ATP-binding protein n=1 Tax=Lutibacter citreus TaxID=2138210 RepID=UPI000DBE323F|nr:ATP-binding protein [Lutibacter citreus]
MPFQNLRKYIIQQLQEEQGRETLDFRNTFSEILQRETSQEEALIILMVLAPHVFSGFYESIFNELHPNGGEFPEWGGIKDEQYRSMQPTGETIQHITGRNDVKKRLLLQSYFETEHWFFKEQILYISSVKEGMPFMSGKIILPQESLSLLMYGKLLKPKFGPDFPAKELSTLMEWEDLVLNKKTLVQIDQLRLWIKHHKTLREDWAMEKRVSPGYKALFYGPSGTGKTLTVSLLGKEFNRPVYRIDLSQIVSKYIGETEKNLEKIFIRAENKDWILFFDEADSLFGKRTNTRSAQDRFANQGVSYLLQRIENFNGVVILASNYKNNIDQAFIRRFNAMIMFTKPNAQERLQLWKMAIPKPISVDENLLKKLAEAYELTGAQIVNTITYSCLQAAEEKEKKISRENILNAIRIEFQKEEKMFTKLH